MRLKNPNQAPTNGGWYYLLQGPKGESYRVPVKGSEGSLDGLVRKVMTARIRVGLAAKEALDVRADVEDQICGRVPVGECWSQGYGDKVHKAIRRTLHVVDGVAGAMGASPKLEKKASGCSGCRRRRQRMNQIGK